MHTIGRDRDRVRSWPILLMALPAFVAIWSGWVGLGGLTGFGPITPLPGTPVRDWTIDTAITLPVGVEAYASYALYVWLSAPVSVRARVFARWSAIGSLLLGAAGQVAYHLMVAAGIQRAPWQVTALVACLPVAVLGMGAALAHLVSEDTDADTVGVDTPPCPVSVSAPASGVVSVLAVSELVADTDTAPAVSGHAAVSTSERPDADTAPDTSTPDTDAVPVSGHGTASTAEPTAPDTDTVVADTDTPMASVSVDAVTPDTVTVDTATGTTDTDTSATPGATDTDLVAQLHASGTRSLRGAQAELHVGRARARRVLTQAWPDASGRALSH
jgi:hypothetical protein